MHRRDLLRLLAAASFAPLSHCRILEHEAMGMMRNVRLRA